MVNYEDSAMPIMILEPEEMIIMGGKHWHGREPSLYYLYSLPDNTKLCFFIHKWLYGYTEVRIDWRNEAIPPPIQGYLVIIFDDENFVVDHFFLDKVMRLPVKLLTILCPRRVVNFLNYQMSRDPNWVWHYDCSVSIII